METRSPFSSPVKEYSVESYSYDEDGKEFLDSKVIWKYNQAHKVSEVHNCDSNDELSEVSYYTYDKDQNLLEVAVEAADGNKIVNLVYEYKDHKLDRITEIATDYKRVTKYDDYGNPIEKQNLGEDDSPFSTTKYINLYDQNGKLIEKHTVFSLGESDWIDRFKYNNRGLLIEEQNSKHQITSVAKHSYNDKGDLILSEYNPGESNHETLKRDIVYNNDNDIIEVKEYRKGWCYQDRNGEYTLIGTARYSYVR